MYIVRNILQATVGYSVNEIEPKRQDTHLKFYHSLPRQWVAIETILKHTCMLKLAAIFSMFLFITFLWFFAWLLSNLAASLQLYMYTMLCIKMPTALLPFCND